jgi:hypothetical protein
LLLGMSLHCRPGGLLASIRIVNDAGEVTGVRPEFNHTSGSPFDPQFQLKVCGTARRHRSRLARARPVPFAVCCAVLVLLRVNWRLCLAQ